MGWLTTFVRLVLAKVAIKIMEDSATKLDKHAAYLNEEVVKVQNKIEVKAEETEKVIQNILESASKVADEHYKVIDMLATTADRAATISKNWKTVILGDKDETL